jgi:6-phosphogluconate dehydrogenase
MNDAQFGMIGLGTMGRNFLLNAAGKGYRCIGYDLDIEKQKLLTLDAAGLDVTSAASLDEFVAKQELPRNIMLLVPAGPIVDSVIEELIPLLAPDDLIIDGGNSHFTDTDRREKYLKDRGLRFLGVGVSGGEEGALHGASIMAGGDAAIYERVRPLFEAVSAKVDGEPCAAYVGARSAGHFVKMVHNGIEYGLMQLIAETFDLMQRGLEMDYNQIADTFADWNKGDLNSFLIEITEKVLRKIDDNTGKHLVEIILDTAGQKGTGKWTSQASFDLGVPVPTIDSAVTMRQLSAMKKERVTASKQYPADLVEKEILNSQFSLLNLERALYGAFILTYAQGLSLLKTASKDMNFGIDLAEVAKIWRGGCIIRAALLADIRKALTANKDLLNLMLDDTFQEKLKETLPSVRRVVETSVKGGFPSYCMASCVMYYDAYHSQRLPANLIQAQRDFFGAHSYQLVDQEGNFHNPDWDKQN